VISRAWPRARIITRDRRPETRRPRDARDRARTRDASGQARDDRDRKQ
jgi:hypothetical protein